MPQLIAAKSMLYAFCLTPLLYAFCLTPWLHTILYDVPASALPYLKARGTVKEVMPHLSDVANSDLPDVAKSPPLRVAVCLSGAMRTFLDPDVQQSMLAWMHKPGYEYFCSFDKPVSNTSWQRVLLKPIIGVHVEAGEKGWKNMTCRCPLGTNMHRHYYPMAHRLLGCRKEILAAERRGKFLYAYILRARPDHLFLRMWWHPRELLAEIAAGQEQRLFATYQQTRNRPPFAGADVLIYDDHMAVARRKHLDAILQCPATVYSSCQSVAAWQEACRDTGKGQAFALSKELMSKRMYPWCKNDVYVKGGAPCCPMGHIRHCANVTVRDVGFPWVVGLAKLKRVNKHSAADRCC